MFYSYRNFLSLIVVSATVSAFLFEKEGLFLVPSVGFRDRSMPGNNRPYWNLQIQGWYYEENPTQAFLMEKTLGVVVQKDLDHDRVKMFTAEGIKKIYVYIDYLYGVTSAKTDDHGSFKDRLITGNPIIGKLLQPGGSSNKVTYQAGVPKRDIRAFGDVFLCDDEGYTFISDIDDTIKITGVTSSTQTLINTFSGNFKAVEGMAEIYRHWESRYNATFAYLTASPDQLYPFLKEFFDREQFPSGSAHMRHFTWLDVNFITFFMSSSYMKKKTETLEMFVNNTLNRKFVLLGDVFQKDPDIYADIHARFPDRVAKIFIRKYADDQDGQQRLEAVFRNVPQDKWATFEKGADLPREIFP